MAYVEQGAVVVVCHREGWGDDGYYGSDRSSQGVEEVTCDRVKIETGRVHRENRPSMKRTSYYWTLVTFHHLPSTCYCYY